jgi:soluble lytic murein transglycosylase-like protein
LSEEVQGYCEEIGEMYGICPELLMAIIEAESSGNQYAENGSCKGLMQVSVRWHSGRMEKLGVTDIYDEYGNILVATDYISELREDYEEVSYVLDVYNGNSKATYNYENGILSVYAKSVLERSAELERLRGN